LPWSRMLCEDHRQTIRFLVHPLVHGPVDWDSHLEP
jgi:hypothetical protein